MKFVILFEDNPDAPEDIRAKHMPDHLLFLEQHRDIVSAAGPLSTMEGAGAGGLWLVDAPDATGVERLVHSDPFWPTGLRKSYRILAWRQVFADGMRQI